MVAWNLCDLGEIDRAEGAYESAEQNLQQSLAAGRRIGDRYLELWSLVRLGRLLLDQALLEEALTVAAELDSPLAVAECEEELALIAEAAANKERAAYLRKRNAADLRDEWAPLGRSTCCWSTAAPIWRTDDARPREGNANHRPPYRSSLRLLNAQSSFDRSALRSTAPRVLRLVRSRPKFVVSRGRTASPRCGVRGQTAVAEVRPRGRGNGTPAPSRCWMANRHEVGDMLHELRSAALQLLSSGASD